MDIERPLKERGRRDAATMGRRLTERGVSVDKLISSPAVRAAMTAELIADELGYPRSEITVDATIYGATDDELLGVIVGLSDDWEHVILIGHNPSLTDLANRLAPFHPVDLPTCGVIGLTYDVDRWGQVAGAVVGQLWFDYPKNPRGV